jgi:hypothetical protein
MNTDVTRSNGSVSRVEDADLRRNASGPPRPTAAVSAAGSLHGHADDVEQRAAIVRQHAHARLLARADELIARLIILSEAADTDRTRLNATKAALRIAGVDAPSLRGER